MNAKGRGRELAKNTLIIAFGQICTKFLWIVFLPIYTSLLSPEEFGTFDLFQTYQTIFVAILFLQISQSIFRYLIDNRQDEYEKQTIITTGFAVAAISSLVFVVGFLLISPGYKSPYILFLLFNTLSAAWSDICLQICRGIGDNKSYSVGSFLSGAGQMVGNILLVIALRRGLNGMFVSVVFGQAICIAFVFFRERVWRYIKRRQFNLNKAKDLLSYSLPLIPNALSWWMLSASDRVIVNAFLGADANGLLAVANRFSSILATLYSIYHISWVESASVHFQDVDREVFISKVINTMLRAFFAVYLGILLGLAFFFSSLIDPRYSKSYDLVPLYLSSVMLINVMQGLYGVVYVALKKTKILAKSTVVAGLISIAIHLSLIHFIGIYAAGVASLISCTVVTIWRYFDLQKYVHVKFEKKLLLSMGGMAFVTIGAYYSHNFWANVAVAIAAVGYLIYINRTMLYRTLEVAKQIVEKAQRKYR